LLPWTNENKGQTGKLEQLAFCSLLLQSNMNIDI
jgi:hypothetical protein